MLALLHDLARPCAVAAIRALQILRRALTVSLPSHISAMRARGRRSDHIVGSWPQGDPTLGPDVAVFVHFDARGRVHPRVQHYLRALRAAGFSVLFVTNSGALETDAEAALRALCDGILVRRNVGYDFGAMREALVHWRLPRDGARCVLLVNDSVMGPFADLGPMLARADFAAADVWGATDSFQRGYHLQSFFLAVGARALRHPAWAEFWRDVRPVQDKEWVIDHYEVGLTRRLQDAGLRCRALFPYDRLVASAGDGPNASPEHALQQAKLRRARARGHALNPTADLWRELLRGGFPFIKRELLGRNPGRIADIADWRAEAHPDPRVEWL